MQSIKSIVIIAVAGLALIGCASGNGYESNPAGAEANSGKKYTEADAAAAQPKRSGSEGQ